MNSFYIYGYEYTIQKEEGPAIESATVIFCSCTDINSDDIQEELRVFYQSHYQTDKIFVIAGNVLTEKMIEIFIDNQEDTFKGLPRKHDDYLTQNLLLLSFDKDGILSEANEKTIPPEFLESYKNQGLQQIFIKRGGLIVSEESHHYVFPSGKHFDRFLRTGNILLYSPEIFFIAFCLLPLFDEKKFSRIYCDTSSINSIAFALFDLKRNFPGSTCQVSIESFSSYEGLYKSSTVYTKDSFLLVSASTSANIIKYILDKHQILGRENIAILYYLSKSQDYANVKDQVLCNLTQSEKNPNGIPHYDMYYEKDCELCKRGSYPVPVSGDVFLLETPQVNKILIGVKDADKNLSKLMSQLISTDRKNSILKVHYKENSDNKYEIFVDYNQLLANINTPKLEKYKEKLAQHIYQSIPANTKYILHLMDEGSKSLAKYILNEISGQYAENAKPKLVAQDDLQKEFKPEDAGAVVIVGSCVSNGKNLLYISRALRDFEKLKIIYFIGIARTINEPYLTQLKSSLTLGKYGHNTNIFIAVDSFYCTNEYKNSSWIVENNFLSDILLYTQNNHAEYTESIEFFNKRVADLATYSGSTFRGINDDLFFKRITTSEPETMRLNKNFAFFNFPNYVNHVTQAEVYFTISSIINNMRNNENRLKQAVYVRNLIDPGNFNRFNDGIIQASILRAANADELSYVIDQQISQEMYNILETMIKYHADSQGEALIEFLYALAIKKMSLKETHLIDVIKLVRTNCKKELFLCFADYIEEVLISKPKRIREKPFEEFFTAVEE
jgi:hypothetical protein